MDNTTDAGEEVDKFYEPGMIANMKLCCVALLYVWIYIEQSATACKNGGLKII